MPDQADFHGFMNLRGAKRHPPPAEGLKAASPSAVVRGRSKRRAIDPDTVHDLLIAAGIAVLVIVVAKWFAP